MKIEKLPSGSYRIRKMYKGQIYAITFEHKPTQKEVMQAMASELDKVQEKHQTLTFKAACEKYIASKRNVLSPSTIRGYYTIIKQIPEHFMDKNIYDITAIDVQTEINRMAKKCSPKTVRNHHGFISVILKTFYPSLRLNTTLPQKIKRDPYIPSDDDIKNILSCAKDTEYEVPIILACYGMRRSEICALTLDDLNGDIITINKSMVQDENKKWIIKETTKTTASTREVIIPMQVADKIREQGYIYKGYPSCITKYLERTEKELNIPIFPMHKLRHYFASKMSAMNIPEADIIKMGGWETDHVMKGVYRHAMEDKNKSAQRKASEQLSSALLS